MLMLCYNRTAKLGHPSASAQTNSCPPEAWLRFLSLVTVRQPCLTWGIFLSAGHSSNGMQCRHSKEAMHWIPSLSSISMCGKWTYRKFQGGGGFSTTPDWTHLVQIHWAREASWQQPKEQRCIWPVWLNPGPFLCHFEKCCAHAVTTTFNWKQGAQHFSKS